MSTQPPRPGESDGSVGSDAPAPALAGRQPGDQVAAQSPHDHGTGAPTTAWRADVGSDEADRAARTYWEAEADAYQAEHGAFLAEARALPLTAGAPPARPPRDPAATRGTSGAAGGRAGFVWGPEGVTESELGMLGPLDELTRRRVLEVGCGAAQCSTWLAEHGVHAVGIDIAVNQLRHAVGAVGTAGAPAGAALEPSYAHLPQQPGGSSWLEQPSATRFRDGTAGDGAPGARDANRRLDPGGLVREGGPPSRLGNRAAPTWPLHVVAATATALPFPDATFDAAFSAYGAVQFVADLPRLLAEVRRVLVSGGRWAFSVTHPIRWAFPDEPGPEGLSVSGSYFDRTPYVERNDSGAAVYAEFHRTVGDYVGALVSAGFVVDRVVEPEWPEWNESTWGGWSPLRGMHLPGTLVIGCRAGAD